MREDRTCILLVLFSMFSVFVTAKDSSDSGFQASKVHDMKDVQRKKDPRQHEGFIRL